MKLRKGFNPDYTKWLETSFTHEAVLECFPIIMRTMLMEDVVSYEDLIVALPEDADIAATLGMNVFGMPDQTTYVSECPNHQSRQEHYLNLRLQLMWRIDEKHPERWATRRGWRCCCSTPTVPWPSPMPPCRRCRKSADGLDHLSTRWRAIVARDQLCDNLTQCTGELPGRPVGAARNGYHHAG